MQETHEGLRHFLVTRGLGGTGLGEELRAAGIESLFTLLHIIADGGRPKLMSELRRINIGPEGLRQRLASALAKATRTREIGIADASQHAVCCSAGGKADGAASTSLNESLLREFRTGTMLLELQPHLTEGELTALVICNRPRPSGEAGMRLPALAPALAPPPACNSPLVSVVTPTTASRHWCHEQLYACFCSQSWPNKELIILDDGPEPSPWFRHIDDGRVRYMHRSPTAETSHETLGEKRNRLNREAQGSIIAHFDDDDLYLPGYLTRMVGALLSDALPADFVTLASWHHLAAAEDRIYIYNAASDCQAGHHSRTWGYGFSYCYTATLAREVPFLPCNHGEDYGLCVQAARQGFRCVAFDDSTPPCTVLHIGHGSNESFSLADGTSREQQHLSSDFDRQFTHPCRSAVEPIVERARLQPQPPAPAPITLRQISEILGIPLAQLAARPTEQQGKRAQL